MTVVLPCTRYGSTVVLGEMACREAGHYQMRLAREASSGEHTEISAEVVELSSRSGCRVCAAPAVHHVERVVARQAARDAIDEHLRLRKDKTGRAAGVRFDDGHRRRDEALIAF